MQYRELGKSGIAVSTVGLGCNNFGLILDRGATEKVVSAALDAGITFFDTADVYGPSEELLGPALGTRRKDVVIATKFGMTSGDLAGGASCDYIPQAVERSLRRLQTDYIDLFYLHTPDPKTPMEETLRALSGLVEQGKVRAIGASNMTAELLDEADKISRTVGLASFVVTQEHYNLLERDVETGLVPAIQRLGLGLIPYFPLANGLLTGKYDRSSPPPEGSRFDKVDWGKHLWTDANFDRLDQLKRFASNRGNSLVELAFAWLLAKANIPSVIAGATSPTQISANARSAEIELTNEEMAELDRITAR